MKVRKMRPTALRIDTNVFDMNTVQQTVEDVCFDYEKERYKAYMMTLAEKGARRPLVQVKEQHIEAVSNLAESIPHFAEVIEFITDHLIYSHMSSNRVLALPPIALGGEPGLGKTHFARKLANILDCSSPQISCGDANGDFIFTGLDRGYNTAYPGKIAQHFLQDGEANPLFILDEFDKPRVNSNTGGSFHDCFFSLLENSTASDFEDQYFKLHFDASHINWICTVNDFESVPSPIRDRIQYMEIKQPNTNQMKVLVKSIYQSLVAQAEREKGLIFESDDDILMPLTNLSPRKVRKEIEAALAKAARRTYQKHRYKYAKEGVIEVLAEDLALPSMSMEKPITSQLLH